ncbi:MAG: hypothetical protein ACJAX5_000005 [Patiriisocius sp.]|jgi:uncharacterized protein YcfJ
MKEFRKPMMKQVMKRITLLAGLTLASTTALASGNVSYEYGKVVEATPIVKNIRISTPREECWDETASHSTRDNNGVSTVLGAVIGGALGNAVGHNKSNQKVGAVVGAVLGGTIGNAVANERSGRRYTSTEEVCRVINDYREEERVVGYHVRYEFNDVIYTTRTDEEPGQTIKLRLSVSPVS